MSHEVRKSGADSRPSQLPTPAEGSHGFALLVAAFAATTALIWGFEARLCNGIVAGVVATLMRASVLAFTHLPELALLASIFAAHLAVGFLASRRRPFRGREALLATVLPLVSFFVGVAIAGTAWVEASCALHPWR